MAAIAIENINKISINLGSRSYRGMFRGGDRGVFLGMVQLAVLLGCIVRPRGV